VRFLKPSRRIKKWYPPCRSGRLFAKRRIVCEQRAFWFGSEQALCSRIFPHLFQDALVFLFIIVNILIVAALPDVRYRQRVQKRITRLRKRLLAFVIKANPECFDHDGRLASGCFPARIPPEATDLHGLMRRAECKLAMIRCHAECRHS
jgi:hypothetical protein